MYVVNFIIIRMPIKRHAQCRRMDLNRIYVEGWHGYAAGLASQHQHPAIVVN